MEVNCQPHTPTDLSPGPHWIGDWVGSRGVLDAAEKRKFSCSYRESNLNSSAVLTYVYKNKSTHILLDGFLF
jgi:hypothetical protein